MLSYILFLIIYGIINGLCAEGKNLCKRCNPVTKLCEKCNYDVLIPDENGGCVGHKKCSIGNNYCEQCQENENICQICEDGYIPDENGGCTYANNCEVSYEGRCIKCLEDFILIGENKYNFYGEINICKSINSEVFKNCQIIDKEKGICKLCEEGYFLTGTDKKCINIENCAESKYGICKKCNGGFYLDKLQNKCLRQNGVFMNCKISLDSKKCDVCNDDCYFDGNGECIYNNFCLKGEDYKCEKCITDYYLAQNFECSPEENCVYAKSHLGICILCKDSYYIDYKDGKCKSNLENNNWKYCKIADGECNTCIEGFYLGEDKKCSYTKYCVESDNGVCLVCQENYHLGLDKRCINVDHCIYSNINSECIECEDKYYYDTNNKTCKIANDELLNCKSAIEGMSCDKCKDDFYLNRNDRLCYSNLEKNNFYKCAYSDSDVQFCESCIDGYYLGIEDFKCTTIDGCLLSENENKCLKCDSKFYCLDLKTGKCELNYQIEKEEQIIYYMCNVTNKEGTACEKCLDGYILNNKGLCVDEIHCTEKKDDVCQRCSNELFDSYCLNDYFGCINYVYRNCLECNDIFDIHRCTKCYEGYELNKYNICIEKSG